MSQQSEVMKLLDIFQHTTDIFLETIGQDEVLCNLLFTFTGVH